jgi:DNA-binding HxlR family transcriptional regulator
MPRITDRCSLVGWRPGTRDKKKRQIRFDFEMDVLTREKLHQAVKDLMKGKALDEDEFFTIPPEVMKMAEEMGTKLAKTLDDLVKQSLADIEFDTAQYEKD